MKKVLCFIISLFILANIVCAQTTITEVTLNLPLPPEVDADIVNDFSVPDNLAYEANNNGKMTIKMIGNSGEITSGKYLAAEEYTWSAIVCPKEGYSFPSKTSDLNFTINGFDINDNTIVASTEKTINNTTCRGLTIYFKALPGVRKRFLTVPE